MVKDFFNSIFEILFDNINLGTFLIATLTFGITFSNFYRNRASIKLKQFDDSLSMLIKPDIIDFETPDKYWRNEYRLITDVVITNQSAKPISIIEFTLNGKMKYNSYHEPGELYHATLTPRESIDQNGILFAYGKSEKISLPIRNEWLQPIIDIPPHTSLRGHLFFHFPNKSMVSKGRNRLVISTSRKSFTTNLNLCDIRESSLQLPDSIHEARNQDVL